ASHHLQMSYSKNFSKRPKRPRRNHSGQMPIKGSNLSTSGVSWNLYVARNEKQQILPKILGVMKHSLDTSQSSLTCELPFTVRSYILDDQSAGNQLMKQPFQCGLLALNLHLIRTRSRNPDS